MVDLKDPGGVRFTNVAADSLLERSRDSLSRDLIGVWVTAMVDLKDVGGLVIAEVALDSLLVIARWAGDRGGGDREVGW